MKLPKSFVASVGEENFERLVKAYAAEKTAWRRRKKTVADSGPLPLQPDRENYRIAGGFDEEKFARDLGSWREKATSWPQPFPEPKNDNFEKLVIWDSETDEFVASYEIFDDTPPPPEPEKEPTPEEKLETRKQELLQQLRDAEAAALEKVSPQRKRRLMQMRVEAARLRDDAILREAHADLQKKQEQVVRVHNATLIERQRNKPDGETIGPLTQEMEDRIAAAEKDHAGLAEQLRDREVYLSSRRAEEDRETLVEFRRVSAAQAEIQLKAAEAEAEIDDLTVDTVDEYQLPSLLE